MIALRRGPALPLLVICALFVVACGESASPAPVGTAAESQGTSQATPIPSDLTGPQSGGVLTFARNYEPPSLSVAGDLGDNGTIFTVNLIFDRLVEVGPTGYDPVPGLAESWSVSDDALSYTFVLRDAKFSNGDAVSAEDVKFSLERFIDPNINTNYASLGNTIKTITIIDPKTVKIDLKRVDGAFLTNLSVFAASIVPMKIVQQLGDKEFAMHPIGTGPFMFDSWTQGQEMKLVRNPNYWEPGKPYLDGVTFKFVTDDNARILGVQSGDFDVAENVPFSQVGLFQGSADMRLQSETLMGLDNIALNNEKAPLDEKAVRQALSYATPKEAILKTVYLGFGSVANSQLPQNKYWDPSIPATPYDLDKARSLLASSSVPNGFDLELTVKAGDTVTQQVAAIVQSEWKKIGVNAKINQVDAATWSDMFTGMTYQVILPNVISDVAVDDELADLLLDYDAGIKSWFTGYKSEEAKQLIQEANSTIDDATRQQKFSELQRLGLDDAPKIPTIFVTTRTGLRNTVHDFVTLPTGEYLLQDVWLSK